MKVFVTGGCGFIGSNFILNHINKYKLILNYDNLTYAGKNNNLQSLKNNNNYTFFKGDICSIDSLNETINNFKPNVVINFAAESHVDKSIEQPLKFIDTNVVGTANLLNICYDYWKCSSIENFKFIHISTDEVYGSLGKSGLFTEKSPYAPSSPYSASKAASDHLVNAWHRTFNFPSIITNCSNNYGPYQFPEKLIPLIITNCLDENILPVYGDGSNIRDWLYVGDHCNAISLVVDHGEIGQTYNIGGNNEIKNIDIVYQICSILDKLRPRENNLSYKQLVKFVEDRPGHDFRYAIDASKIKKSIGWSPKENIKTGLLKTINWYLDNENWWRNAQINDYNHNK